MHTVFLKILSLKSTLKKSKRRIRINIRTRIRIKTNININIKRKWVRCVILFKIQPISIFKIYLKYLPYGLKCFNSSITSSKGFSLISISSSINFDK